MKKEMTLAEVKEFFGEEKCFETETGFLVNRFGKYRPNITFVVPKVFDLGKDRRPISPLTYTSDKEVTDNMNLDFGGSAGFIFGDFWRSKKGGACFRPKSPMWAKHLLIRVDWGGAFNRTRGNYSGGAVGGVLYFRRASSNGGGTGYDYWVVPVGFYRSFYDPEFDGEAKPDHTADFEQRAKAYRKKHADLQRAKVEEADVFLREKAAAEEASKKAREKYLPRLQEIRAELAELHQPQKSGARYAVDEMSIGEAYLKIGYRQHLYSEESLAEAEQYLLRMREWILDEEDRRQAEAYARKTFQPKYEELRGRIEAIGWGLSVEDECARVEKRGLRVNRYGQGSRTSSYRFDSEAFEELYESISAEENRIAEEERRSRNTERIHGLLSETGLPEDLWFLFDDSEDLDSDILKEAKAILAARSAEKDSMDMHELRNCGYDRRCGAIRRVLARVGGGHAKIDIGSQANSVKLAYYIAG